MGFIQIKIDTNVNIKYIMWIEYFSDGDFISPRGRFYIFYILSYIDKDEREDILSRETFICLCWEGKLCYLITLIHTWSYSNQMSKLQDQIILKSALKVKSVNF